MSVSPSGRTVRHTRSGRQGSRTHISTRENRVSTAARPTVSGYLPFTSVDPPGIEPGSPACRAGVVPLEHEPSVAVDRMGVEPITPTLQESVAPSVHASPQLSEVRPGIEPGPRPYHGRVLPEHLQTIFHQ
jgi:hypothetical protein